MTGLLAAPSADYRCHLRDLVAGLAHELAALPARFVESASGVRLRLVDPVRGPVEVIDAMASWWSAVHGYAHPVLDRAVTDQLGRMSRVMFGGLTHRPAITLASRLVAATPDGLDHRSWRGDVARIEAALTEGLASAADLAAVRDVRVLGAVGVVQLHHPVDMVAATAMAVERGVWLRPFRDLLYTTPPYLCTDDDVAAITTAITEIAAAAS